MLVTQIYSSSNTVRDTHLPNGTQKYGKKSSFPVKLWYCLLNINIGTTNISQRWVVRKKIGRAVLARRNDWQVYQWNKL